MMDLKRPYLVKSEKGRGKNPEKKLSRKKKLSTKNTHTLPYAAVLPLLKDFQVCKEWDKRMPSMLGMRRVRRQQQQQK